MKFSATLILASSVSASAQSIRSASLLSSSRMLDDAASSEVTYFGQYKSKYLSCTAGQKFQDPSTGAISYSTVAYRLCPQDSCDDNSVTGCKAGYGDFITGIDTFVKAWLEDMRNDMYVDDNFKIDELGECREYKADNKNNGGNDNGNVYYVGPACDESTGTIKVALFTDQYCSAAATDITFEELSNGWSLPFNSGGLVTRSCEACTSYNDAGALQASQICAGIYADTSKCETKMSSAYSSSSLDESGCSQIETLLPKSSHSSAGAAIGWTIFVLVLIGGVFYGYSKWWVAKKQGSSMSSGGVLN